MQECMSYEDALFNNTSKQSGLCILIPVSIVASMTMLRNRLSAFSVSASGANQSE